jgi:REP element-mobilizing transposase RayT
MMGRPLRIEYPGAYYHVTSRGNEQKDVFMSQTDRQKFLSYLESAVFRYGAVVHVWCLMNNHYHLLMETPSGNLSRIMQHINGAYTNYYNVKRKRAGHLFQGRYKAIIVEADEYAKELSRYIHLNPVNAGIVSRPEEYRWSSYREYIGLRKAAVWLKTEFVLGYFDKSLADAGLKYRKFVEDLLGQQCEGPLARAVAATILGKEGFVTKIAGRHLEGKQVDRDLPAVRKLLNRPTMDLIIQTVKAVMGKERVAEKAGIYFCHTRSGAKLKAIGERFGIGESAVTQASRRFARQFAEDEQLKRMVVEVERMLSLSNV